MAATPVIDRALDPVQFRHVLFPTDFSPCSDRALSYALRIAAAYHSRIFVLHVLPPEPPASSETVTDFIPHLFDVNDYQAEKRLRALENSGVLSKLEHSVLLLHGHLRDVLESTIQRYDIDLVVLGTHGRGGIQKLFFGSVAEEVSRRVPCAVLMMGPHVTPSSHESTFGHVLYATEFAEGSLHALRYATSIAQRYDADLTLLHVCSFMEGGPFVENETVLAQERERLQSLLEGAAELSRVPSLITRIGVTPDTILRTAREMNADLIVMGVRSAHSLAAATHLPWTVVHQIVCNASCPVLTVRG